MVIVTPIPNPSQKILSLIYDLLMEPWQVRSVWFQNPSKDITYGLITCLIRPEKIEETNRTRLVVGGDRVHYPLDTGTPTADLLTIKLLINGMISTPGARFFTIDIKNFYLCTPMTRYE